MENVENITIGRRLRKISDEARKNVEIDNFVKVLEDVASKGQYSVMFPDLQNYLGTLIQDGSIFTWLMSQDIKFNGSINSETGAYEYTLSW